MIILNKLFLNSKLELIRTVKFVKQRFRIQILKGEKVLLWNKVKSRMEACYSELILKTILEYKIKKKIDKVFCYKGTLRCVSVATLWKDMSRIIELSIYSVCSQLFIQTISSNQ